MPVADIKELMWLSVLTLVELSLVLSIGSLLTYQLWLVSHNKTTIDYYAHAKEVKKARQAGEKPRVYYPFDLGSTVENMRQTLGPSVWTWLLPTEPIGDGLTFRMSRRAQLDLESQHASSGHSSAPYSSPGSPSDLPTVRAI